MLAHSFFIESSSKLLVTRTGIKARTSSISGLWFPWPIHMFFEMRFDLGTLDSGEWSLPFGLLVLFFFNLNNLNTYFGCHYATPGFYAYKGKRKLKLLITWENLVLFTLLVLDYRFLFCFVNILFKIWRKKVYSQRGVGAYSKHD